MFCDNNTGYIVGEQGVILKNHKRRRELVEEKNIYKNKKPSEMYRKAFIIT